MRRRLILIGVSMTLGVAALAAGRVPLAMANAAGAARPVCVYTR